MSKNACWSFCHGTRVTISAYTAQTDDAAKIPPIASQVNG
jgi:hypothetical protein